MTHRERVTAVFTGRKPDRMVWSADLGYWYQSQLDRGCLPERYQGDGVVRLYQDLRVGAQEQVIACPWTTTYDEVEITGEVERGPAGEPLRDWTEWRTPVGTLRQERRYMPGSCTWVYRRYPVSNPGDLRVVRFIAEHSHVAPAYESLQRLIDLYGEDGVAGAMPLRSPMAQLLVEWMGVTNTCYALADAPAEVEATIEALDRLGEEVHAICCASPAPLLCYGDNVTGEIVSPSLFRRYYAPCYRRRTQEARQAGKWTFVHVDGTLRTVLPLLAETGIDCGQSLTPAPVGDVPIGEMRSLAGPDLILWGGVPGAYFSRLYPVETLLETVREAIEVGRQDPRLMLCVCDQVPPDAEIDRVKRVSDLVEEEGWYG